MDENIKEPIHSTDAPESVDYEDKWKRAVAALDNYKKEEMKRYAASFAYARADFLRGILPIFDSLERAVKNRPGELAHDAWADGVARLYDEFLRVIEVSGFTRIATLGAPFDPKYHEAVGRADDGGEDVVEEIRSGFVDKDDFVLRPAQVKIGTFH